MATCSTLAIFSAATLAAKLDGWYGLVRNALPLKRRRLRGNNPRLTFYKESLE